MSNYDKTTNTCTSCGRHVLEYHKNGCTLAPDGGEDRDRND